MLRNKVLSIALLATTIALPAQIIFAPTALMASTKQQMVKLAVRNDSTTSLDLQLGDQKVTIAPGKTMDLKLPVGTRITTASQTPHTPSGTFIIEVTTSNNNSTIAIT
jgi:hypothetical protein